MEKDEIYDMVIREMTELAIQKRDEEHPEENELKKHVQELSIQVQKKLNGLPVDVKRTVTEYIETSALAAADPGPLRQCFLCQTAVHPCVFNCHSKKFM